MRKLKQSEIKAYREEMLEEQNGKCAFCGEDCEKPCLDHAHLPPWKDKVRGVICNWCNIAIGKLENARVRTGTSWEMFEKSFPDVHHYIWHYSDERPWSDFGYENADWHPSKRKSEVTAFSKLHAGEQLDVLKQMGSDLKFALDHEIASNKDFRIKLFKKLNNKTK